MAAAARNNGLRFSLHNRSVSAPGRLSVDVEQDGGFVTDRPGIVAGRDDEGVASFQLTLGAIPADDLQAPLDHDADSPHLAASGLRHRLFVLRPLPTGLVVHAENAPAPDVPAPRLSLAECSRFVGSVKALL